MSPGSCSFGWSLLLTEFLLGLGAGLSPGSVPEKPWLQVLPLGGAHHLVRRWECDQRHGDREQGASGCPPLEGITQICLAELG